MTYWCLVGNFREWSIITSNVIIPATHPFPTSNAPVSCAHKNLQQKRFFFGTKHPHSMNITGWGPSELFTRCVGANNQKTMTRVFSIFGWGYKATHITGGPHPVGYSIKKLAYPQYLQISPWKLAIPGLPRQQSGQLHCAMSVGLDLCG